MPGLTPARKRRPIDSDDDDEASLDASSPGLTRSNRSKRARFDTEALLESPQTPLLPSSYRSSQPAQTNGSHGAPLKHQPGSIVRVTLKNFVTYTAAEFLPGPSLNMVVGPNGTGKSTLVCAICLGLAWDPKHLGRAKELSEFVKHGSKEAEIEIELAADPTRHQTNPVVKHLIKRQESKSHFFIDNKSVSKKAVLQLCKSFCIQVDNLCQFLPQDRVVEFAALSPVDLLAHTQRAAAPDHMVQWHEELKSLRAEQKKSLQDQQAVVESLKNLEGRQNLQRADVERLQERSDIQERISALQKMRVIPAYRAKRIAWAEVNAKKTAAAGDLTRLETEVEPALRAVNAKDEYRKTIEQVVDQRKRIVDRAEANAVQVLGQQTVLAGKIEDKETEKAAERDVFKRQKQERARLEAQLSELKRQHAQEPVEFDAALYNERLREISRQMRQLGDEAGDNNEKQKDLYRQKVSREQRVEQSRRDLDGLRSAAGQQNNKLKQESRDTAAAWAWVQANTNRFSGPVFGPPVVSCTVKDPRHANIVESVLSKSELCAFTVTNQQDFRILQKQLYDTMRLGDIYLRNSSVGLDQYRAPVPQEELQDLGLDAYLLDLIDGPSEVLGMLCDNRNIHQTGVAFRDITNDQYEAITRSPISSFITPKESYIITRRREYGDRGTSTRTNRLRPARFFTEQPVDSRAEEVLKDTIRELEDEMQTLEQERRVVQDASRGLAVRNKELVLEKKAVGDEKEAKQKALSIYNALPVKIANLETKRDAMEENQAAYRDRQKQLQDQQDQLRQEKGQEALNYANAVTTLQRLHMDLFEAELLQIEATSDFETLQSRNLEVRDLLERRRQELEIVTREAAVLRDEGKKLLAAVKKVMSERTPREQEIQSEQPEAQTCEELENEIEGLNARLDMVHEGNPHVLREYEERGQKIEKATEKLARLTTELARLNQVITVTRDKWEPELDALIAQISAAFGENFARIGCAGQVEVYKDEDFENWAIQVQVKFRENEQLSILDSHRQSGGERAVSTIFYLMALQSLARAPFRVVDEINQGMDPKNERLVHSRMVSIACAEHTSQYFLITPKLLPNLTYHPNMKVHCIASGEYMPSDHRKLDFPALAKKVLMARGRINGVA